MSGGAPGSLLLPCVLASTSVAIHREGHDTGRAMPRETIPIVRDAPRVAVVDPSEDIAELLRIVLEGEGLRTVIVRHARPNLATFLSAYDPPVVVWDVAFPYAENWASFRRVCDSVAGRGRRFVVTTTDPGCLSSFVGEPTAIEEIVRKPFGVDAIVAAVRRALGGVV